MSPETQCSHLGHSGSTSRSGRVVFLVTWQKETRPQKADEDKSIEMEKENNLAGICMDVT